MSEELLKVIVVDDEAPARGRLVRILHELEGFSIAGEATNGIEAIDLCEQVTPDIVLMDIRMPGMDGIEAARHLAENSSSPAVIFTTAFNEYAIDAFDAQAIGYLMKPVRRDKLARALERASRLSRRQITALGEDKSTASPRTHLSARVGDRLRLIPWDEIQYFLADQKYVAIGLQDEEVLIDDSLKSLENEFGDLVFRIHRNSLVVVRQLRAVEKNSDGHYQVIVSGSNKRLAVSRRQVSALRKLIKNQTP